MMIKTQRGRIIRPGEKVQPMQVEADDQGRVKTLIPGHVEPAQPLDPRKQTDKKR